MTCTTCGRQLDPAATTCPSCGMPAVAQSVTPMTPIASSSHTGAAQATGLPPGTRSAVGASILEWLMPGTGLMYAGRIRTGVFVLVRTQLAQLIVGLSIQFVSFQPRRPIFLTAQPTTLEEWFSTAFVVFPILAVIELLWLVIRIVWVMRVAGVKPPRIPSAAEAAAGARTLRIMSLFALVPFALAAILVVIARNVPNAGSPLAPPAQYALAVGTSIAFVAVLIVALDMRRARRGIWPVLGLALIFLYILSGGLQLPNLIGDPTDVFERDPVSLLIPAIVPLLTLAYAVYSIRQRPLSQPQPS